jgi:hypothetical protein
MSVLPAGCGLRVEDDEIVMRPQGTRVGPQRHPQQAHRVLGHAIREVDRICIVDALVGFRADGHVQPCRGLLARSAARLHVDVEDQDLAPLRGLPERRAHDVERIVDHRPDLAPHAVGALDRLDVELRRERDRGGVRAHEQGGAGERPRQFHSQ